MEYESQKRAWMDSRIFIAWLIKLNVRMKNKNRKILLLLDNAPVHPVDLDFSNIEILFYPPNFTSLIQPCDQGIIKTFKTLYKKNLSSKILFNLEKKQYENLNYADLLKKLTLYDCICFAHSAWIKVSTEAVINCLKRQLKTPKNCVKLSVLKSLWFMRQKP
jgi:hypothetical protein